VKQKDIVKLLRKEFGHHEVTVFTASVKNRAGILDCDVAYNGESIWVEIKIGSDSLKRMQQQFMRRHQRRSISLRFVEDKIESTIYDCTGYPKFKYYEIDEYKRTFEYSLSEVVGFIIREELDLL